MLLNKKKSKTVSLENVALKETSETKLLGVIINNKLDWDNNTAEFV